MEKQNFVFFSKKINLLEIQNPVPRGGFLYLNFNPVSKCNTPVSPRVYHNQELVDWAY